MSSVSQSLWKSREEITGYPIYVRPCSEYFKELILESSDVSEEIKDYVINVRQNYKQWCDAVDNKIQATKLDLLKNLTQSIEIFLPISSKIETGYQRILKTLKDRNCYDKQIVQHYENELKNSINFINAVIFDRSTEAVSMVNGDMLLAFATPLRSTIIKSESTVKNVQEVNLEIFNSRDMNIIIRKQERQKIEHISGVNPYRVRGCF